MEKILTYIFTCNSEKKAFNLFISAGFFISSAILLLIFSHWFFLLSLLFGGGMIYPTLTAFIKSDEENQKILEWLLS